MTREEIKESYNIIDENNDCENIGALYDMLIDFGILTENEAKLVIDMDGFNEDTLLKALYCKSGLRSLSQLLDDLEEF